MAIRRAKIVCTIGPACDAPEVLRELIDAGMDVARLNFSHGTHGEHEARIARIREVADACGRQVAILQDLCGPKIRCAKFDGGGLDVPLDATFELVVGDGDTVAAPGQIAVQYPWLADDLKRGDQLLLDDGRVSLRVTEAQRGTIKAVITQGGRLRDKAGVHLPAERIRLDTLTQKDRDDLAFGLAHGVDYVGLSFVRSAADVRLVRDICEAWGRPTPIVAKIETPSAIDQLEPIILAADGVMVARGDLGVEFAPERVPVMQRRILGIARKHQRPVIVATEMMQSMITATRPTRAEASDVATAVFDGTDAVMLSGETATGDHPALVVRTMARIIVEAEQSPFYEPPSSGRVAGRLKIDEAVARNACEIARDVEAEVIVAFTESGRTARFTSKARPRAPVIGLSPNVKTLRRLCLLWGVTPWFLEPLDDADTMISRAEDVLRSRGLVGVGDRFVTIFGAPVGVTGTTNAIRVKVVA